MTKRLKILSNAEVKYYYNPPVLSSDEHEYYFTLDAHEETRWRMSQENLTNDCNFC